MSWSGVSGSTWIRQGHGVLSSEVLSTSLLPARLDASSAMSEAGSARQRESDQSVPPPDLSESSSVAAGSIVSWQPIVWHFPGSRLKAFAALYALPVSFAAWLVEMASQGYKAEMAPAAELEVTEVTNTHSIKAQKTRVSEEFKELEKNDPLLKENPRRWVMFPLQHPEVRH